ncbi:5-formyltetrahydrofolate cyclo-ligase [Salisediminibacterium halotolerans]|uniref:5-formyltetrahydrofolate cyclo-ligase n=1 Tax=Salisediminibacterium halotolerans TaxID=517425 RepID=UPI000EB5A527|nr:5-formyltetrahydrofolate cyclo-ligase [Salisediminibacterium halotolerans]RLJ78112.1 5-formyltetrahydrofolate cyclo-ligase [Actinophytocola xinjiangensis]RPE88549.1 5-formyltetrahydrofolate cyclo-ligase [Salisediminibacterium halotolerans]TWG37089.1 5-formyltetrahydrofolate cyclo-ligase [Salisediminibacterium halotolerans]GEL09036.1 hypothetical protein SHA02_24520 [Salisediminibacterium halotolerans]
MSKKRFRENVRNQLQMKDKERVKEETEAVQNRLFAHDVWQKSSVIALTYAVGDEFPTKQIIEQAFNEGKRIAMPKCVPETKDMRFYEIEQLDQLEPSFFGLMEPDPDQCKKIVRDQIDLLIVPGLVYDRKGYRIGFGGGYFDRFLAGYRSFDTVSLAYREQLATERFPNEPHDQRVNFVITADEVIECQ